MLRNLSLLIFATVLILILCIYFITNTAKQNRFSDLIKKADQILLEDPQKARDLYTKAREINRNSYKAAKGIQNANILLNLYKQQKLNERQNRLREISNLVSEYDDLQYIPEVDMFSKTYLLDSILKQAQDLSKDASSVDEAYYYIAYAYAGKKDFNRALEYIDKSLQRGLKGRYFFMRAVVKLCMADDIKSSTLEWEASPKIPYYLSTQPKNDLQLALNQKDLDTWQQFYAQILITYLDGKTQDAISLCNRVFTQIDEEDRYKIYMLLGNIYLSTLDYERAVDYFSKAADIARSNFDVQLKFAITRFRRLIKDPSRWNDQHEIDSIARNFETCIIISKHNPLGYVGRGRLFLWRANILIGSGDPEPLLVKAMDDFTAAIGVDPSFYFAHFSKALVHSTRSSYLILQKQDYIDEAKKALFNMTKAISLQSDFAELYAERAQMRVNFFHDLENAITDWEEAVKRKAELKDSIAQKIEQAKKLLEDKH